MADNTLALSVKPFDLASPLMAAQTIIQRQDENRLTSQLDPIKVEQANLQTSALRRQDVAQDEAFQNGLIAEAAARIDPGDPNAHAKWDAAMQAAADKGADGALQWVGRYSPQAAQQVAGAYSAKSPLEAQSAFGASGAPAAPATPEAQYDLMFKDQSPAQLKQTFAQVAPILSAAKSVLNSQDPVAAFNAASAQLGYPQMRVTSALQAIQAAQNIVQHEQGITDYLQRRVTEGGAGLPTPIVAPIQKAVGDVLYTIDPRTGKATREAGGKWTLVGTDPETKEGIYSNVDTGEEKKGDMPLAPKPGSQSNRMSVYQLKQQAWMEAHPGDTQGALEYANGKKAMSPEQARVSANGQAARDLQAATLAGEVIPDAKAYLTQRSDEIFSQLTGGGGTPAPAAANPPASALAALVENKSTTFRNGQVWTKKNGKPVRLK